MTDEQIFELAKTCGFEEFVGEKDDETDGVYWQFWEEQLLKFAKSMYDNGYIVGLDKGINSVEEGMV